MLRRASPRPLGMDTSLASNACTSSTWSLAPSKPCGETKGFHVWTILKPREYMSYGQYHCKDPYYGWDDHHIVSIDHGSHGFTWDAFQGVEFLVWLSGADQTGQKMEVETRWRNISSTLGLIAPSCTPSCKHIKHHQTLLKASNKAFASSLLQSLPFFACFVHIMTQAC